MLRNKSKAKCEWCNCYVGREASVCSNCGKKLELLQRFTAACDVIKAEINKLTEEEREVEYERAVSAQ